ncbi:MAG: hypothetical protein HQK82_12465, partial [Desulfovibrionaceae bacterium]|nr:hypothetical protein [Desulfovibrionaceae bacterium]
LAARFEAILDDRLAAQPAAPEAAAPDLSELAASVAAAVNESLQTRLDGLRDELTTLARELAPDTHALAADVTTAVTTALGAELRAAIDQAVPAAAATIIREEIAALASETD